ncbi:MAG: CoA transferase, partial [Chloroflexota bacterium]
MIQDNTGSSATLPPPGPLHGLRVVDLATERAELAGRVLADLGAEVVKVEPPGGARARFLPPFERGREGSPDGSLYWATVGL